MMRKDFESIWTMLGKVVKAVLGDFNILQGYYLEHLAYTYNHQSCITCLNQARFSKQAKWLNLKI